MFTSEQEQEIALGWCRGNTEAVACLSLLAESTQLVDDLVDERDEHILKRSARATEVYDILLVRLPSNPFWQQFGGALLPTFMAGVLDWDASNFWQKSSNDTTAMFGFVRREAMDAVVVQVAYICGGIEHARNVAREVHDFYHVQHADGETLDTWRAEA